MRIKVICTISTLADGKEKTLPPGVYMSQKATGLNKAELDDLIERGFAQLIEPEPEPEPEPDPDPKPKPKPKTGKGAGKTGKSK